MRGGDGGGGCLDGEIARGPILLGGSGQRLTHRVFISPMADSVSNSRPLVVCRGPEKANNNLDFGSAMDVWLLLSSL